ETFVEFVRQLEGHGDDERAGLIDVAPATGVFDETDVGNSFLPDVDGRESFREVAADVEWRRVDEPTRRVYVTGTAAHGDECAFVAEIVCAVELRRDTDAPRLVYVAPLIVFDDIVETRGRALPRRGCHKRQCAGGQAETDEHASLHSAHRH